MKDRVLLKDKVVKKLLNSEHPVCREYLVRLISESTGIDAKLLRNNIELITPNISSKIMELTNLDEETYNEIINDLKKRTKLLVHFLYIINYSSPFKQ